MTCKIIDGTTIREPDECYPELATSDMKLRSSFAQLRVSLDLIGSLEHGSVPADPGQWLLDGYTLIIIFGFAVAPSVTEVVFDAHSAHLGLRTSIIASLRAYTKHARVFAYFR